MADMVVVAVVALAVGCWLVQALPAYRSLCPQVCLYLK